MRKAFAQWFMEVFCNHVWEYQAVNVGCYDAEEWYQCRKCGKEKD